MNITGRKKDKSKEGRKKGHYLSALRMKPKEWQRAGLILSFLVPALIMFVLFILREIYPFGDRSFLFSDMYHQYMPFFSEFMHKIKAGEGLSYSYHVGIGSNFLALYVYYLASPLHWLAFVFPVEHLMEFMSYLVIIKIGLCGLTSAVFLKEKFGSRGIEVMLFSCFYALSGFMAAYNWNIMWLDCVILIPLILLGLERLVKQGRCVLYCVTLALSIFTNYYISIMICIFLVLYFVVLLITEKRSWVIIRNFILFSLLAGGMAAILLVPEVFAILETDFGDMDFPEQLKSYFSVLDMLARHGMCVVTERGLEHWPNIYSGVVAFVLIPIYALNQKISMRRKFCFLGLAGILLISFSTNMLDFIWHGLNYPDSLPARQSFLYILLVLLMNYEAFRKIDKVDKKQIMYGYLCAVVFILFCEKFVESEDFETGVELLTLGFVTAYAVLLYLYRTKKGWFWRQGIALMAFALVVAETSINTFNTSVGTTSRSQYLGQQADYEKLVELAWEQEVRSQETKGKPFFRFEKFTRKTKNDGTLTGYPTASVFSSTLNSYVMDLYKKWGMRHSKVYYGFDGATAFTAALLNVNYMFGEDESFTSPMHTVIAQSGDIYLYQCLDTLPFGYVAPTGYNLPDGFSGDALKLQNRMITDLGVEGTLFRQTSCEQDEEDVRLTVKEDGYYYMQVNASGTNKIEAMGDFGTRKFQDLKDGSILYLGYLEEGEEIRLTNGDDKDDSPKITLDAYIMEEAVLKEALSLLSEDSLTQISYDSTHVSGEITLEEEGRLILSIPYEKGWNVVLDGEKVQPELFGGTLMAFDLQAGHHTLSMSYIPHGKYLGILISVVSIGLFAGIIIWGAKRKIHSRGQNTEEQKELEPSPLLESVQEETQVQDQKTELEESGTF